MSTGVDYDDDWAWVMPVPDGVMHTMPDLDGVLSCCGRTAHGLPLGEGMTADPARATCQGVKS